LAALAGVCLANSIALRVAPCYVITQARELLQQFPAILRWELLPIIGGVFLLFARAGTALPMALDGDGRIRDHQGAFLSIETHSRRRPVIDWWVGQAGVDYRFRGLGLCTLAILLLYALGWSRRS